VSVIVTKHRSRKPGIFFLLPFRFQSPGPPAAACSWTPNFVKLVSFIVVIFRLWHDLACALGCRCAREKKQARNENEALIFLILKDTFGNILQRHLAEDNDRKMVIGLLQYQ